jgi:hypothetical protein
MALDFGFPSVCRDYGAYFIPQVCPETLNAPGIMEWYLIWNEGGNLCTAPIDLRSEIH